jgi:hypothetical protein
MTTRLGARLSFFRQCLWRSLLGQAGRRLQRRVALALDSDLTGLSRASFINTASGLIGVADLLLTSACFIGAARRWLLNGGDRSGDPLDVLAYGVEVHCVVLVGRRSGRRDHILRSYRGPCRKPASLRVQFCDALSGRIAIRRLPKQSDCDTRTNANQGASERARTLVGGRLPVGERDNFRFEVDRFRLQVDRFRLQVDRFRLQVDRFRFWGDRAKEIVPRLNWQQTHILTLSGARFRVHLGLPLSGVLGRNSVPQVVGQPFDLLGREPNVVSELEHSGNCIEKSSKQCPSPADAQCCTGSDDGTERFCFPTLRASQPRSRVRRRAVTLRKVVETRTPRAQSFSRDCLLRLGSCRSSSRTEDTK